MLTERQLIQIADSIAKMPDTDKTKKLFAIMFKDYREYVKSGTPEDFAQCKEWQDMSITEIRQKFNNVVKGLRDEVTDMRNTYQKREQELQDKLTAAKSRKKPTKVRIHMEV